VAGKFSPGASGLFVAKPLHPSFRDDAGLSRELEHLPPADPPTSHAGRGRDSGYDALHR